MHYLFEKSDNLSMPMECFLYDCSAEVFPIKPHWHYFAEFVYVVRGTLEVTADDKTYLVSENELILFPPSCVHSIFSADGTLPLYAVLKFDLGRFSKEASYTAPPAVIFRYAGRKGMSLHFDASRARRLGAGDIFKECMDEMQRKEYGYDILLRSQIYRLLFRIIRMWMEEGLVLSELPLHSGDVHDIENVTEYIDSRLEEPLRVTELAEFCHMSYSTFAAKFHERHGMSCKEYMERMRVFRAEEYLLFTNQDLNYISQQTGFSDCSHFIRCFKKYKGITPGQFRMKRGGG